jgi:signal transduction histidine kinase
VVGMPTVAVALAVLAALGGLQPAQAWRWAVIPLVAAGVMAAERFPVKIGPDQQVHLVALPCLVAALLLPPGIGPAVAALSVLAAGVVIRRTMVESILSASAVLAASATAAMIGPLGRDVAVAQDVRATAAAAAYLVVNRALAVLPTAVQDRQSYFTALAQAALATWPASLTLAACAVTISVLAIEAPLAAPLPLIVLPLIYRMNLAIEAQAKANAQLAAVLAAQRRFLTDVSHQVATPLATITTNLAILSRSSRRDVADVAVADSVAEAERMKRMLGRLRALAHADEDVPLRREAVELGELAADVVRAFAGQADTSGVGLVSELVAPASVSADKDLLREAVANLVDNALRFSPRGSTVRVRVERGSAGPQITVSDSGPGIASDRLPRLFERFQRSDSGSGLGLAIARRVVERHGGTIRVASASGVGSTFTVELPGDH